MKDQFSYLLYTFTSLFTIVNPLGAMPFFSGMTEGEDLKVAKQVAFRACLAAFTAMVFFAVSGQFLFRFFNVSVDGLRIVGGVLFFIMGYDMLQGKESRTKSVSPSEKTSIQDIRVRAITPLAIPLICGPGTITVITVLMQETQGWTQQLTLFSSAFAVCFLAYFILVGSKGIMAALGESGQKVFFRMMGLILMMIAVEFFFTGLRPYVQKLIA